jgi:putative ABC transport system ATP-binding protein
MTETISDRRTGVAARAEAATKVYGTGDTRVVALDAVTVDFATGEMTAIMGPSGSGKSTLMHCVAGLDDLTDGRVFIADTDLTSLNDRQLTTLRRDQVGFVFQAFNLVPTLNALENITLPAALAGRKPDKEWLDTVIKTVGLGSRLTHRPSELSGGQQQRVAVARALASGPDIVFADEPTGNLDSHTSGELMALFQRLNDHGITILLVTHEHDIAEYARRIVEMRDGRILRDHPVTERRVAADGPADAEDLELAVTG